MANKRFPRKRRPVPKTVLRLPPRGLPLFEAVINAVHKAAPGAAIAFNTRPDDSADAAARWVAAGSRAV